MTHKSGFQGIPVSKISSSICYSSLRSFSLRTSSYPYGTQSHPKCKLARLSKNRLFNPKKVTCKRDDKRLLAGSPPEVVAHQASPLNIPTERRVGPLPPLKNFIDAPWRLDTKLTNKLHSVWMLKIVQSSKVELSGGKNPLAQPAIS